MIVNGNPPLNEPVTAGAEAVRATVTATLAVVLAKPTVGTKTLKVYAPAGTLVNEAVKLVAEAEEIVAVEETV